MRKRIAVYVDQCLNELPAFIEMWLLIKQLPTSTPETNPILRYRAKQQMEKAPTLTATSLAVPGALFLLLIVLAITTGVGLFAAVDVVIALVLTALLVLYHAVRTAKPVGAPAGASATDQSNSIAPSVVEPTPCASEDAAAIRAAVSNTDVQEAADVQPIGTAGEDAGAAKCPKEDDNTPAERPTAKLDTYCKRLGAWVSIVVALAVYYSMNANPGMWMGWIFFVIISWMLRLIAHDAVNIYVLAFVDPRQTIPVGRVKVLKKIAYGVVCIPFLFTAYGAIKGGYEVFTAEKSGDQMVINMFRYKLTCANMNWLTRLGYRWAYHSLLDFKETTEPTAGFSLNSASKRASTGLYSTVTDADCSMEIGTALMEGNIELARQWAQRIKNDRLRRYQLALIMNQEKIRNGIQQMQNASGW